MEGGNDWLEAILKRKAYDESPIKILDLESVSRPGKGENYLSKISKIRAKVLLGSGRVKNISFLVKRQHETEHIKNMSVEGGIFFREIMMYRDILPKMQELLEDINDPEGVFWPKCYDIRLYDRLVFEDLGDSGFRTADRFKQLSLNAALSAIKHFAKFHALSKILIDRGDIQAKVFGKNVWIAKDENIEIAENITLSNAEKVAQKMDSWGDEWKEAGARLRAVPNLRDRFIDSFNPTPDEFTVLCHCDSWTNNMLFSGEDLENPTGFRLIDFQLCCFNSPAKDISQLLVTSVRLEDRKSSTELLIQTYVDTLKSYLLKLGYEGAIPTVEDINRAMDRKAVVRLCDGIGFVPILIGDAAHAPNFEQAMNESSELNTIGFEDSFESFTDHDHLTPLAESVIKYQVEEAMTLGVI